MSSFRGNHDFRRLRERFRGFVLLACGCLLPSCGPPEEVPAEAGTAELLAWAQHQQAEGRLDRATEGFRRALRQDSSSVEALSGLAGVYEAKGLPQLADRYRGRVFFIHYTSGLDWLAKDRPDRARPAFDLALGVRPHHPLALLRLGELAQAEGRLDSAIACFERAVDADPDYSESSVLLGKALARAGDAGRARQAFERAIEININALDAYLGLGALSAEESNWLDAAAQYEKALLADPRSEVALRGLEQARTRL